MMHSISLKVPVMCDGTGWAWAVCRASLRCQAGGSSLASDGLSRPGSLAARLGRFARDMDRAWVLPEVNAAYGDRSRDSGDSDRNWCLRGSGCSYRMISVETAWYL